MTATPPRPPMTARLARPAAAATDRLVRSRLLRGAQGSRFAVAVAAARTLRHLDRATDTRIDPSRAGRALLAAAPHALGTLAGRLAGGCALVSATNGKTTTTNLLAAIVRAGGQDPVVNHVGANMPGGLTAELLARARRGRVTADLGVFEIDELWLDHVVPPLLPKVIVLGNLFRDQLDRMGELDRVAARWRAFVAGLPPEVTLVVNADDPRVCQLAAVHPSLVLVGMDGVDRDGPAEHADIPDCQRCGTRIAYDGAHIGHLGRWRCPACGDRRPEQLHVVARDIAAGGLGGASFTLVAHMAPGAAMGEAGETRVTLAVPGRFNVANAALAGAAALSLGHDLATVTRGLGSSPGAFGRAEELRVAGRPLTMVLGKNPTGLDEVVTMLTAGGERIDLLLLLNDRDLDGRDVSWIWDVDMERLAPMVATLTCGGARASEAAMRMDYAGVDPARIEAVEGIAEPLARALARTTGPLVAVCNYSAMLDLRETLAEQGHTERYWR
ncbi:MAG: DUF1727 domain-containing protein [Acidimicrobiaceae bacterium]|nr:DUF1727 domain-containing protein [Ilumatobacter sp.]MCB9381266.1 DUF1727 domain-containing protein [Acidimicrobiaceae bacterium]MCO5330105.1 MurT ligase domain-containing protein [Ilumatobacteraceae bacterium]